MRARACWFSLGQYAWGGPRRVGRAPGVRTALRRPRFRSRSSWIFAPSKWPQMASGRQLVHDPAPTITREYFAGSQFHTFTERGSSVHAWHLMAQAVAAVAAVALWAAVNLCAAVGEELGTAAAQSSICPIRHLRSPYPSSRSQIYLQEIFKKSSRRIYQSNS